MLSFSQCIFPLIALAVLSKAVNIHNDPRCPIRGSAFLRHENCSKYIVCDNGDSMTFDCPAGLYFNPISEICDYQWNVPDCMNGTHPPTTGTPPINSTTVTPPINTTTVRPPINGTTITPPINSTTVRPPINGTTITPPINSTTVRPPINGTTITPPINSTTVRPPINGTTITPPINSTTVRPPINGTTPSINSTTLPPYLCSPDLPFPMCPCPFPGDYFVPYPGNCSLFINCVEGLALLHVCPTGTLFDPVNLVCQPESIVNCTRNGTNSTSFEDSFEALLSRVEYDIEPISESNNSACQEDTKLPLIPSMKSCAEYFICQDGAYLGTHSCPQGHHFDYFSQSCVPQGPSTCLL